jgi:hypothetical protein
LGGTVFPVVLTGPGYAQFPGYPAFDVWWGNPPISVGLTSDRTYTDEGALNLSIGGQAVAVRSSG